MCANSKSFSKLIISWTFVNKGQRYLVSVTFIWTVSHSSGVERENERESFPLNSLVWNLIIQPQWFFTLLLKSGPNTGRALQDLQQRQPAQNPDGPAGQGSLSRGRNVQKEENLCHASSPAERLHHLNIQEEKMKNIYFFGHPFPTAWETQVWALESPGLYKSLLLIFLLNSNMYNSWFHPRADQKLLKS